MADYIIQDSTLTAIADAVRGKTGDVSVMTPMEMVSAIEGISTGGGGSSGGEEWIGDGNTHLWIHLAEGRTSPMLGVCPNGTVTVDWGDGTTPDVLTGTSTSTVKWTPNHEYGKAGDYVITLTVDGEMGFTGDRTSGGGAYLLRHVSSSSDTRSHAYRTAIKRVELGSGITSIGQYAFYNCYALTDISIPEGVTSIGNYAFYECRGLEGVAVPESVTTIGSFVWQYCYGLKSVVLPNGVTSLGKGAFQDCSSLKNVNIPAGLTAIFNATFQHCYSLQTVNIPEGVKSIGGNAFYGCYSVSNISFPDSVTSFDNNAFYECYGAALIDFSRHTTVPTLSNANMFYKIPADCVIRIPAALADEWKAATNWSTYADKIVGV